MSTSLTTLAQVPHTFSSGQAANAEQVNANFAALVSQINQLQTQVQALQAVTSPSVANLAGSYRLMEVSVDVDAFEQGGVGIAGEHNTGVVTLNANGTGVFNGTYTYRQVSFFQYPYTVRAAGGANDTTLEQTDYQVNTDGGADGSEFTWTLDGKVITVNIPAQGEDPAHSMTFYAANSQVLISGDDDEGQATLAILVRQ